MICKKKNTKVTTTVKRRNSNKIISVSKVAAFLTYEPETGVLRWKPRTAADFLDGGHNAEHNCRKWNGRYANTVAGYRRKDGYIAVMIDGSLFLAHRIAYALYHGEEFDYLIDHKDGDPTNNKIDNLRKATANQNSWNSRIHSRSKSGIKGVYGTEHGWIAQICVNNQRIYLGVYKTKEEAGAAYAAAAMKHFGDYARV